MSRAFTKEAENEEPRSLPERPLSGGPNPVTPRGARLIEKAIQKIEQQMMSENNESLARDLRYWLARKATMQVVSPTKAPDRVGFGTRVTIRRRHRESEIEIVGVDEADAKLGLISWIAPLARAIEDASVGEKVELSVNGNVEPVTVVAISRVE